MPVYNRTTLALEMCLLLSPESAYAKAAKDLAKAFEHKAQKDASIDAEKDDFAKECSYVKDGSPHWPTKPFLRTIGINWERVKAYALSGLPTVETASIVHKDTINFRNQVEKHLGKSHPLLSLAPIEENDICIIDEPNNTDKDSNIGEEAVWRLQKKLGLTKAQAYYAFDVHRHMLAKPNCGHSMEKSISEEVFRKSKGVYLVVCPSVASESDTIRTFPLRVMHEIAERQPDRKNPVSCIRAKLNMPNIHKNKNPHYYQYRGFLIPTNSNLCWSFEMNQAPYSAVHEENVYNDLTAVLADPDWTDDEQKIQDNQVPLNYSDDVHLQFNQPNESDIVAGIMSSLSQRPDPEDGLSSRHPYACTVFACRLYEGDFTTDEKWFMKHAARSFESLREAIEYFEKGMTSVDAKEALPLLVDTLRRFNKYRENSQVMLKPPSHQDVTRL